MTVSTVSSSPLVVVVGATGAQGGSVVRNLIESDRPYRIRGLTRDTAKPASIKLKEMGVEVVQVDIAVGKEAAVRRAFQGADIIFGVTDYWQHMSPEREIAEGKLMIDAAVDVGAKLFIWSGLEHVTKNSGGKYSHVVHFDSKAQVAEYARSRLPIVDVQAGHYMTNLLHPLIKPRKVDDGSYEWEQPPSFGHGGPLPFIDTERDYGLFVRFAIEDSEMSKGGGTIHTYGEMITQEDAATVLESVRRIKMRVTYIPTVEAYRAKLEGLGFPEHAILDFLDFGFMTNVEEGYYFGKERSAVQQNIRSMLARKPRTWEEFLKANPEFFAVDT
ncbi:NAD(P)-binding protein [Exidia glandulosa HHB12029]|uniref:NAD(P)-binding protein n=1 Tax=Exidia glandulosa HHB12029 TaxID=1314781 RepID=A0A165PPE5_EXIGL|nr:NAD(P)-binding protein [Exidia glandulosa HHB12029]